MKAESKTSQLRPHRLTIEYTRITQKSQVSRIFSVISFNANASIFYQIAMNRPQIAHDFGLKPTWSRRRVLREIHDCSKQIPF